MDIGVIGHHGLNVLPNVDRAINAGQEIVTILLLEMVVPLVLEMVIKYRNVKFNHVD